MKSPFVDVKEVSEFLGVGRRIIYRLVDSNQTPDPLPHFRLGKKIKFQIDSPAMREWIERRFQGAKS